MDSLSWRGMSCTFFSIISKKLSILRSPLFRLNSPLSCWPVWRTWTVCPRWCWAPLTRVSGTGPGTWSPPPSWRCCSQPRSPRREWIWEQKCEYFALSPKKISHWTEMFNKERTTDISTCKCHREDSSDAMLLLITMRGHREGVSQPGVTGDRPPCLFLGSLRSFWDTEETHSHECDWKTFKVGKCYIIKK